MLELDLVFDRFWSGPGKEINESEAAALERLLALPDNDLLDLVMGRSESPEEHLRALLAKVRAS